MFDHWDSVIRILNPILEKNNIGIVQIGDKKDKKIKFCIDATADCDENQTAYIIKRALLHLGIDGFPVHVASGYNKRIVALYSNQYASQVKPYWSKKEDVILLESDKGGDKPTYSSSEVPKTINTIKPEEICRAVCSLLGLDFNYNYETIHTGRFFQIGLVESVPEKPIRISNMDGQPTYLRADIRTANIKVSSSAIDAQLSAEGKYSVMTDRPIDIEILRKHKDKIEAIVYIINKRSDISFYSDVVSVGLKCNLATYAEEKEYNEMKFRFLDYPQITKVNIKRQDRLKEYSDEEIKKLFYQSNKYLIYDGKFYPSQAALEAGEPAEIMDPSDIYPIPDKPVFFKDFDHVRILKKLD